jgi:CBS domain-containing protein
MRQLPDHPWHHLPAKAVLDALDTIAAGLHRAQVTQRLAEHGPNRLAERPPRPSWLKFLDQFKSRPVIVVAQDSAVADAWRTLREDRIRQAPVVDDQRKLIGLVSERGLLTAIDVEDGQVIAARRRKVRGVMTTPVVAAAPTNDIRRIASVMLDRGVDGVPVIAETGRIVGFVSRSDILRAVVADPPLSLWR